MGAFGFSIGVGLRQRRAGEIPPAAVSAIASLVVQGAGVLPDGADAADPNGWIAKAVVPLDGAASFDPGKIVLTVADPGFAPDGSATVRTRTIRGGAVVRRQYPNQGERLAVEAGGNLEAWFSLEEFVFAGSTIVGVAAEAGYYGDAAAGAVASIVNQSTRAYPKPLFGWLNLPNERATGTHFAVEAVAYHALARMGAQVACVEFVAEDGSGNATAVARASAPGLSDFQTLGQPVEAWKAQIPLAGLAQDDVCTVDAVAKPWIGEAWTLSADEVAWPTPSPQTRLIFKNDRDGVHGLVACVKAGASGGTVQTTIEAARGTPYPTWNAAVAAIPPGGTVYLMDDGAGGAVDHAQSASLAARAGGDCWTDIRVDPAATGAVRIVIGANKVGCDLLRFACPIHADASFIFDSGNSNGNTRIALDGVTVTHNGGSLPALYRYGLTYLRNVTYGGTIGDAGINPFRAYSSTRHHVALALGCVMTGATANMDAHPFLMIGCDFRRVRITESNGAATPNQDVADGMIVANNRLLDVRAASELGLYRGYARGIAIVQNVLERAGAPSGVQALSLSEGANPAANIVLTANTIPGVDDGGRLNWLYTDDAGVQGAAREGVARFNLLHSWNVKSDTFVTGTTASGRVGNWPLRYMVGSRGNVVLAGSGAGAAPDPGGASWLGEHWPDDGFNVGAANVAFADSRCGTAGAGGGDYALAGAVDAAFGRVPAGTQVLAFDLGGAARRGDGSGAAGAYERG